MTTRSGKRTRGSTYGHALAHRRQILVFAEGKKTESIYLTKWQRIFRESVIVNIAPHQHTTPFELAQAAASQRRRDLREAKRGRGAAYDEYWCISDVDEHPRLPEALELARANEINVALSSPCIELWFILHFTERTAYLDRKEAQELSKELLGCDKVLTPAAVEILVANYEIAKGRALALRTKHIGDASARPWNPYSNLWRLIESLKGVSEGG